MNLWNQAFSSFSSEKNAEFFKIRVISPFLFEEGLQNLQDLEFLGLSKFEKNWLKTQNFEGKPGQFFLVPEEKTGRLKEVWYVQHSDPWDFAKLSDHLPMGQYEISDETQNNFKNKSANKIEKFDLDFAYLVWGLAFYRFDRFINKSRPKATLKIFPEGARKTALENQLEAIYLVRDLVNTPAESLGPEELQAVMAKIATENKAELKGIIGDELLTQNFPAIHAVGRAAGPSRAPRLLHLSWGNPQNPLICLVGKGVCFDTGGLNIKDSTGMSTMKKDMGGAAHALALGQWIMKSNLPVFLHVIVPAVENSISGNSYRPGDVIQTRKGLTVEIVNTDAEGRVILSDALAYANELDPKLLIDFATLTGAARVALGPDLPVIYASDKNLAKALLEQGEENKDLLWELPLYQPYREYFKSDIADMTNSALTSHAGSITAALFLESFVEKKTPWVHVDVMAWNPAARVARPKGGEAQGLRAFYYWIKKYFKKSN
jgi:leucyl aminopeptidase